LGCTIIEHDGRPFEPLKSYTMPIGAYSEISPIVKQFIKKRPRPAVVLDLGCGMGLYGALVRQYIDMGVQPFKTKLHGVEGFEKYRNPTWSLYDEVFVGDIVEFRNSTKYDLVFLNDVLEHLPKADGLAVITRVQSWLNEGGIFIISTPAIHQEQGVAHGNEFEIHRCVWSAKELEQLGFEIIKDGVEPDEYGNLMLTAKYLNSSTG